MQHKNNSILISVIGIIIIVFTFSSFFLLNIEKIAVNWWALSFLLLSEFTLFGGLIGLRFAGEKSNKVFLNAGAAAALSLYFIVTLISALFAGAFREHLHAFIFIELAVIVLFTVIILLLLIYSGKIARRNEEDLKKVGTDHPNRGGF